MAIDKNIIFVDTETTGAPKDSSASYKNIDNWPNITQISWLVHKKNGILLSAYNYAISEDDSSNPISATDYIPKTILPIHLILDQFLDSLSQCDDIVGHNIDYDVQVILCELYRYGKPTDNLSSMRQFCTMKNTVKICAFDTKKGDRYPKLQELYSKLFHHPFDNAHDAYCDVKATSECYWHLFRNELFSVADYSYLLPSDWKSFMALDYREKALKEFERAEKIETIFWHNMNKLGIDANSTRNKEDAIVWSYFRKKYGWSDFDLKKHLDKDQKIREEIKTVIYIDAIPLFNKAAKLGDCFSEYRIGKFFYKLGNLSVASFHYELVISKNSDSNDDYMIDCYFESGCVNARLYGQDNKTSLLHYNRFIELCENNFNTNVISRNHLDLYIKAFEKGTYGQQKNLLKAIEICTQALMQGEPEFVESQSYHSIRYKLATLYVKNEDYKSAIEQYMTYLLELDCQEFTSHRYDVRQELATLYRKVGDNKSSIEQYIINLQEIKNREGNASECINIEELIVKYSMEDKNYTNAKQYIDIILSDNPSNAVALYSLGQFYELGLSDCRKDDNKAFECYEKASKYIPAAMKKVGIMYLNGIGCKKSKKQARYYLTQVKNKGLDVSPYLEKATPWYIIKKLS